MQSLTRAFEKGNSSFQTPAVGSRARLASFRLIGLVAITSLTIVRRRLRTAGSGGVPFDCDQRAIGPNAQWHADHSRRTILGNVSNDCGASRTMRNA